MTLVDIQQLICAALREKEYFFGVPVVAEDEGNVAAEREADAAKAHLAVTVGAASFTPTSRNSSVITGTVRLNVTVYEQPTRNRIGQAAEGRTATEIAEAIACSINLLPYDGGVIVFTGIGDVKRVDDATITRTVGFETLATLTGE